MRRDSTYSRGYQLSSLSGRKDAEPGGRIRRQWLGRGPQWLARRSLERPLTETLTSGAGRDQKRPDKTAWPGNVYARERKRRPVVGRPGWSGGQGVAGSNPASPTARKQPWSDIRAGQALSPAHRLRADTCPAEPYRVHFGGRNPLDQGERWVRGVRRGLWPAARMSASVDSLRPPRGSLGDAVSHHEPPREAFADGRSIGERSHNLVTRRIRLDAW